MKLYDIINNFCIWKAFQNIEEWCFPFWNIFFDLEILTSLYHANYESDDVMGCKIKMVKW